MSNERRYHDDYQVNDERPDWQKHVIYWELGILVFQLIAEGELGDDFHKAYDEYYAPATATKHRHLGHRLTRIAVHARAYYEQCRKRVVQPNRHEYQIPTLFLFGLQLYSEQHQENHHWSPSGQCALSQSHFCYSDGHYVLNVTAVWMSCSVQKSVKNILATFFSLGFSLWACNSI